MNLEQDICQWYGVCSVNKIDSTRLSTDERLRSALPYFRLQMKVNVS